MIRRPTVAPFALAAAVLIPLTVAIWHGVDRPYWSVSDADIIYTGEALRALDGRPYFYTDHPGYTYTLVLSAWLRLLHGLGLIPAPGLGAAVAAPAVEPYLQAMVWAGRLLSAVLASAFVAAAAGLARLGGASRAATAMFALALACSAGIAVQAVVLRAEMMSGGLSFLAFGAMAVAARSSGWRAPAWLAAAGALALLAMEAKVQAIIPLLGLPALALALEALKGPRPPGAGDWRFPAVILGALSVCVPSAVVVSFSLADFEFGPSLHYQGFVLAWICVGMVAFSRLNHVPLRSMALSAVALAAGMALGFLALFLRHSYRVVDAVVNPVEHMLVYSRLSGGQNSAGMELLLAMARTGQQFAQWPLSPLHLCEVAALAGAVLLWRRRSRRAALLSVLLVGLAFATEVVFGLRGTPSWYLVYMEPWVLAALLAPADALLAGRLGRQVVMAAALALVAWTGGRALGPGVVPAQPVSNLCAQADSYVEADLAVRFHPVCRQGEGQTSASTGRSSAR